MTREQQRRRRAARLGAAALICVALPGAAPAQPAGRDQPPQTAHANHAHADPAQTDPAHAGHAHAGHADGAPGQAADAFETRMDADMARMMRDMHAPGYSGDRDIDFLAMMIPHHQGAIDMARLVLEHGADPLTRQLAEEIIASQRAEIDAMKARLALLRQGRKAGAAAEYPALSGLRGPAGE